MNLVLLVIAVVACVLAVASMARCHRRRQRMEDEVDRRAEARIREYTTQYDQAVRIDRTEALGIRRTQEEELKLVAKSALCVLWFAGVEDKGQPDLIWNLRVFAEEQGEFLNIEDVPAGFRVGAWYNGRDFDETLRLGDTAHRAICGGAPGYRQEFKCKAHCKKIRDDDGYWSQIESYISTHADVAFTHGICPDCARKNFPEVFGDKSKASKK